MYLHYFVNQIIIYITSPLEKLFRLKIFGFYTILTLSGKPTKFTENCHLKQPGIRKAIYSLRLVEVSLTFCNRLFIKSFDSSFPIFALAEFVRSKTCIKFQLTKEYFCADTLTMLQKAFGDQSTTQKHL